MLDVCPGPNYTKCSFGVVSPGTLLKHTSGKTGNFVAEFSFQLPSPSTSTAEPLGLEAFLYVGCVSRAKLHMALKKVSFNLDSHVDFVLKEAWSR